ncbi:hypothetical protein D3C87_1073010 [compost metagenome]
MSCASSQNNTWSSTLDYSVVYTGQNMGFAGYTIKQGENLQAVIENLALAIEKVDTKEYYEPFVLIDDFVDMDLTAVQLNSRYPTAPVTGVVYNTEAGYQYTKISALNWKFEIIEIR